MRTAVLLALASSAAFSQAPAPRPSFEVASIKPNHSGSNNSNNDWDNGLVRATNVTLKQCIASAYDVRGDQISGPDWLATERFDIVAKAGAPVEDQQIELMLQSLLADRFHLALHRETREMKAYALVVAKGGSKLTPAPPDGNSSTRSQRGRLTARHTPTADLADTLAHVTGLRVVDKNGPRRRLRLHPALGHFRHRQPVHL